MKAHVRVASLAFLAALAPSMALADMPSPEVRMPRVAPPPEARAPKIDVVFVIDATGSMADEIEQVKNHLWQTAQRVMAGTPRPDVRFGIVVYRDRTDSEHTRVVPLTRDVETIHTALMGIRAIGGGDNPEDVDAGVVLAVREMDWARDAAHLVFLIGDASAHDYGVDRTALLAEARQREISIHTVQASGIDPRGTAQFQAIAQATGGVAEVLTYTQNARYAGREVTVMRRGGETWVSRAPLAPAERALSVEEQRTRGLVVRDDAAASVVASASPPSRASRGRGASRAPYAPSAAPAPSDSDIGGIVAREARRAAEAEGVAY